MSNNQPTTLSGMVDKLGKELKSAKKNIALLTQINEQLLSQQTSITSKSLRWLMLFAWVHGEEQPDGSHRLEVTQDQLSDVVPYLKLARKDDADSGSIIYHATKMSQEEYDAELKAAKEAHMKKLDTTFNTDKKIIVPD